VSPEKGGSSCRSKAHESVAGHVHTSPVDDWEARLERARERTRDGEARLPGAEDADARQRQLTRLGNAAYAAGEALLMLGRRDEAAEWLGRAAQRWRESIEGAPAGSWGRPIGALKAHVLAGDSGAAEDDARWALELGADEAESPIGRYAAALAHLVLGDAPRARVAADALRASDSFPPAVADALAFLAAEDVIGYADAIEAVLRSFETRDEYLEDMPVADTVLVLQALARWRGLPEAELSSALLPARDRP
jgi:tetratricopeptide (TPR) repeat protein